MRSIGGVPQQQRAVLRLLAGVVLAWGTNWPVTKMIVQDVPPLWATALRCMIAAAMLAPMLWAQGQFIVPKRGDLPVVFCTAILHLVAFSALVAAGLQFVPAGRAIVLGYTTPLWVAIGAAMFLSEPITRRRDRHRLRPGGPCGHLQSADAELGRPQRAVRQRPDSARRILLGRQHRLCPGAQMDLDALPARILAGFAGGRAALGHRLDHGRRAAHRVDRASRRPDAL